jgi:hypothetical protein
MSGCATLGRACEVKHAEIAMAVKPIGTTCIRCDGQANVLIAGWTPEGPEETSWTCPRCLTANPIVVAAKVVGVAIGTGRVVNGTRPPLEY